MHWKYKANKIYPECKDSILEIKLFSSYKISISVQDIWSFYAPHISSVITASLHRLHMKVSATDKNKVGWLGQSCVCLQSCNRGLTWPSPPSSACVVASKGPWSSSWKNQAGSLPPLQVRCGDEKVEMKEVTIRSDKLLFSLKSIFFNYRKFSVGINTSHISSVEAHPMIQNDSKWSVR